MQKKSQNNQHHQKNPHKTPNQKTNQQNQTKEQNPNQEEQQLAIAFGNCKCLVTPTVKKCFPVF